MPEWLSAFWDNKNYKNVLAGINEDDCAVVKIGNQTLVITVDYLNSNPIALEFGIGSFFDLGRLLVAANLSDLCGTGAKPIGFLAAIMLDKISATKSNFIELMTGIRKQLSIYQLPLIGGDTKLGKSNSFCGVAVGIKEKGTKLFLKNGAVPGDNIWLSGKIGSVAAAIDGLKTDLMSEDWKNWAKKRITSPKIPIFISRKLARTKKINSGTDLSDGLAADLYALCEASKVGAVLQANKLPVSKYVKQIARERKIEAWNYGLTIGGDFQFIVTAKKGVSLKKLGLKKIGFITKDKGLNLKLKEAFISLPRTGHSDYKIVNFKHEVSALLKTFATKDDQ